MATTLAADRFWVDKANCHNAERQYYELLSKEEKVKKISGDGHLNGVQEPQTKLKKSKKLKYKKNEHVAKLTEISTNSESEERFLSSGSQVNAPIEVPKVVAKQSGEKPKKRNKGAKKNADMLGSSANSQCTLVSEIAKAREHIKNSLEKMDGITTLTATPASGEVLDRVAVIEKDNADLRKLIESLRSVCLETQSRITALEKKVNAELAGKTVVSTSAPAPASNAAPAKAEADDDDDDVDLFGSEDEEDEEAARVREERLAAYAAKKSKKPQIIAKSSLILDVKPWDDETDLKVMETEIRKIETDGLLWGASKFVPVAFGIQKLSISCVVEDDKVSIDWLTEEIEKLEDYVQSVDVAAFNKI
ncbi:probable elongation factor 1-delta isoform X1 [Bactrocera neohumeralis]|uniref:probable elongation factor 1-delta isoform X1 n=1 Tax=Bactrocera neohumeralis TaxID=98809 RepID=UPI002165280B|nr:probable elongation factor 1-delta isoform X1 [Bactrocera neohumeralis]